MTKINSSLARMRAAHEAQVVGIRAQSDFRRVSDGFDVEYEVARQMQAARREAGLSQAALARRMHTTQSVVSRRPAEAGTPTGGQAAHEAQGRLGKNSVKSGVLTEFTE